MLKRILPTIAFFARNPGWHSMPSNASWKRAVHTVAKYGYIEIDHTGNRVRFTEDTDIATFFSEKEILQNGKE